MRATSQRGLTLIEILLVVAIIGILAVIAVPGLVGARVTANERSTIALLNTLAINQNLFAQQAIVDQDSDGEGEYGTLGELTGTSSNRGGKASRSTVPITLAPDSGEKVAFTNGYFFKMYLPGSSAAASEGVGTISDNDIINAQEENFRCYAWPKTIGGTGKKAFAIDRSGNVYATDNEEQKYQAKTNIPGFQAAVDKDETDSSSSFDGDLANDAQGKDGAVWSPLLRN